jgi:hypothetical protein
LLTPTAAELVAAVANAHGRNGQLPLDDVIEQTLCRCGPGVDHLSTRVVAAVAMLGGHAGCERGEHVRV